jgi:hypothetical protein
MKSSVEYKVGSPAQIVRIARNKDYTPRQLAQCFNGMSDEVAQALLDFTLNMLDDGTVVPFGDTFHE